MVAITHDGGAYCTDPTCTCWEQQPPVGATRTPGDPGIGGTGPGDLYRYRALLLPWTVRGLTTWAGTGTAWHDGDTFNALVDLGLHGLSLTHVRCAGYNAPELSSPTRQAGAHARDYASNLVDTGSIVYLDSLDFEATWEEDSFGRMLAAVTLDDGRDLAALMIEAGQAVRDTTRTLQRPTKPATTR